MDYFFSFLLVNFGVYEVYDICMICMAYTSALLSHTLFGRAWHMTRRALPRLTAWQGIVRAVTCSVYCTYTPWLYTGT